MPSVDWNKQAWDQQHGWQRDGDEWSGLAAHCGQPYDAWKQSLIDTFLAPHVTGADVLEVAPGHGRWTSAVVPVARHVTLVDLSPTCIDVCRERFAGDTNITYVVNDGRSMPTVPDDSVDFVWSIDSFVHIEPDVVDGYLAEFARVLRPGGRVVIHHADRRHWSLAMAPVTKRLGLPGRVVQRLASQGRLRDSGNRSYMSARLFAELARKHGLHIERQTASWGPNDQYNVDKYRDVISVARHG